MTINKTLMAAALAVSSFTTQAGTMGSYIEPRPWSVIGGLGYTWYDFGYHGQRFPPTHQHYASSAF